MRSLVFEGNTWAEYEKLRKTDASPDISPVCGIMAERFCPRFVLATKDVVDATSAGAWNSGHPGPRPSGARCARVHLRSCSDVANLGQNIRPESAKRTVVQTATLDTGDIFMPINKLRANESVLVKYPGQASSGSVQATYGNAARRGPHRRCWETGDLETRVDGTLVETNFGQGPPHLSI